ncbi:transporter [Candidatus Latescibacterota bacterium]
MREKVTFIFYCCLIFSIFHPRDAVNAQEWDPVSAGPITTWTAPVCAKGEVVIQPFFFSNRLRGTYLSNGTFDALPEDEGGNQFIQQLFVQYGYTDRIEIDGQVEYQTNTIEQSGKEASAGGFGESVLFLRYCVAEEQENRPYIAGMFQLKIPTGKFENADPGKLGADLTGNGSWDHGYGINMSKKVKPFVFHADAIMNFPLRRKVEGVKTTYGTYLNYDAGLEYYLPGGMNLLLECNGLVQGKTRIEGDNMQDSDGTSFTVVPGIGWSNEQIQTLFAYQRTVFGKNSDAFDSVVFTLVYAVP